MPDKKEHTEYLDLFSLKVRQKMEEHTLPVDAACWEAIEGKMKPRRYRFYPWIGGMGGAVAAVILLFLLLRPDKLMVPVDTIPPYQEVAVTEEEPKAESPMLAASNPVTPHAVPVKTTENLPIAPDTFQLDETIWDIGEVASPEAIALSHPVVKHHTAQPAPDPSYRPVNNLAARTKNERNEKGWLLAANTATGGHLSLNFLSVNDQVSMDTPSTPSDPSPLPPPGQKPFPPLDVTGGPETFSYKDCAPPLSVGFTVRKKLNKRIGIESGLVYTYLVSKMQDSYPINRNASLKLHYLGIPLNLVVTLWDNPHWNLYLSGGVMVEKGLRSIYQLDVFSLKESSSLTRRSGIDGLQWSLNISAGVSYRFTPDWSLYLEPRYSYYFDNAQPASYRTENTTLFGIGAGIRFEF